MFSSQFQARITKLNLSEKILLIKMVCFLTKGEAVHCYTDLFLRQPGYPDASGPDALCPILPDGLPFSGYQEQKSLFP